MSISIFKTNVILYVICLLSYLFLFVVADGTEILVRQCGDNDWGSHCGDITYINGDSGAEKVTGCLETCDHDGCNAANRMFSVKKCIYVWLCLVIIYIIWL
jgi:hypothetical protein